MEKKVRRAALGNWKFQVAGLSHNPHLVIQGFNLESTRRVSRIESEVKGEDIVIEVYSVWISPLYKSKMVNKQSQMPLVSFSKEIALPTPVLTHYMVYYRDIDGKNYLIHEIQIPENLP